MVDDKSQIVIGVRRDEGRDGRDAGDVVESRVVGQVNSMTADGVIIVDNSSSQSFQGSVRSSVQDGIDSERRVVEKQMLVPQVPNHFVDARAHSHASFSAPPTASHVSPVIDGESNILAALSQMLDQKIAPLHESQNK